MGGLFYLESLQRGWGISSSPGTTDDEAQANECGLGPPSGGCRYPVTRTPTHVRPPPEVRERLILLEDRLERVTLRRSAVPAALGLFLILAVVFLGEEILGGPFSTATFSWILLFGVGTIAGIALNEITARRTISALEEELKTLRAPYVPGTLTSGTGSAS